MTERLSKDDAWNDEVCQAWLDMIAEESASLHYSSSEQGLVLRARMPKVVAGYRARQIGDTITQGFLNHWRKFRA